MTAGREEKHGVIRSCFNFLGMLLVRVTLLLYGGDAFGMSCGIKGGASEPAMRGNMRRRTIQ